MLVGHDEDHCIKYLSMIILESAGMSKEALNPAFDEKTSAVLDFPSHTPAKLGANLLELTKV